jgi:hypothetical protein
VTWGKKYVGEKKQANKEVPGKIEIKQEFLKEVRI